MLAAAVFVATAVAATGIVRASGRELADRLGFGEAFAATWAVGRWPLLFLVAVWAFAAVYRFGPNVRNRWRDCVPGALLGVTLWLLASAGLRVYLRTAGDPTARFAAGEEAGALLAVVGALVGVLLWVFLSSVALLVGGELNAEIAAARPPRPRGRPRRTPTRPIRRRLPPAAADAPTQRLDR